MSVTLSAGRRIDESRPDYEEAMALTRQLRAKQFLVGQPRGPAAPPGAEGPGNVLSQGLGWGIGLGLGFWLAMAMLLRQFL